MRTIKFFSMIFCLVTSMGFISCGGGDDEPGTDSPNSGSDDSAENMIIGTWKEDNDLYKDNNSYFLQDGNGYQEYFSSYSGVSRSVFLWSFDDGVLTVIYVSGTEYKYSVQMSSETMVLTNIKNGKEKTYKKLNNNGTTDVDYNNPPFINYVEMLGVYYPISKAVMRCKHAAGTNANMKHLQFFGDNEQLTPIGVWFVYSTPYYEGINKEWSDGTYSIKSDPGFWTYSGSYCYKGTSYQAGGSLSIKTVNSIKIFDFTLDGGDVIGHLEGNWGYE